jgi:hypothetical protein
VIITALLSTKRRMNTLDAQEFFEKRGLDPELVSKLGVTVRDGKIGFPYRSNGQHLFWKVRPVAEKKFWLSPAGKPLCLWLLESLQDAVSPSDVLAITEGECMTGDTQVLGRRGWVRLDEYADEEVVQAHEDGSLSFALPSAKIVKDYNGEMIEFAGKMVSVTTTPGHNLVAIRNGKWVKQRADEMF